MKPFGLVLLVTMVLGIAVTRNVGAGRQPAADFAREGGHAALVQQLSAG